MKYNYKPSTILAPVVLSIVLALGIFIGSYMSSRSSRSYMFSHRSNKLDLLLDLVDLNYVDSVSKTAMIEKTIPLILKNLDPHSVYIPAQDVAEVNEPLEGKFSGIGIQFNIQSDTLTVVNTVNGGPSEKVGVKAGDRIVKINDTLVVGRKLKNEDVIKKLRGDKGSQVSISVRRRGVKDPIRFEITRDDIPLYSVDVSYMIAPNVGYVKVSKFAKETHEEFMAAVNKLHAKGMNKVILDLRGNGGGYLETAIKIADEFLPAKKLIVYTKGRKRNKEEFRSTGKGTCQKDELVVLIDPWSASASEIVAGALQDNDRGTIIGQRSFGKGLVQEPVMFKDGSALRLTIARYYTPTGRCIQKPYSEGYENYMDDLSKRYKNGEFEKVDSTKFADSLKFKTPKGKLVYGGGGIMPDIFVPVDTSNYSHYFSKIQSLGLLYKFSLVYTDNHRQQLSACKTAADLEVLLAKLNPMKELVAYAKKNGVPENADQINRSGKIMDNLLKAYIGRAILDNDGLYPILNKEDRTVAKALEQLSK